MSCINSKKEMHKLFAAGEFGNKLRMWDSLEEVGDFPHPLVIRYKTPASPWCIYNVTKEEAAKQIDKWVAQGAKRELFYFNELGFDKKIIFQGEVQRSPNFFDLTYSNIAAPMRIALAKSTKHLTGIAAYRHIQDNFDAPSWDNLHRLFDKYPDSVIEFATYSIGVGDLGWNTVFWEVRNY